MIATRPTPRWATVLDGLSVFFIILAASVFLFGGARERIGTVEISIRSWARLGALAAALMVWRHAFVRDQPLHDRARDLARRLRASPAVNAAWLPFVTTRLGVLLAGYFAVVTIGFEPGTVKFRISYNELINLPARWDAQWYLEIARHGYHWNGNPNIQQTVVFFPAVPLGMHLGAFFAGGQLVNGGLVVALVAFFFALVYLYRLAMPILGDRRARATVWALAAYPFAVYFAAPYTEAVYLLGCLGAFFHLARGEWRATLMWGLLVGLCRPNGFFLAIPLATLAAQRALERRALVPGEIAATIAPVAGVLAYSSYLYLAFGDPIAWLKGQAGWERSFAGVWGGAHALVMDRYDHIARSGWYHYTFTSPFDAMHSIAAIFVLVSVVPTLWRFGLPYALFTVINIIPPLLTGGTMSVGRMTSVLFPAFMWIGAAVPERYMPGLIAGCSVLQGLIAVLFFTWRAVY